MSETVEPVADAKEDVWREPPKRISPARPPIGLFRAEHHCTTYMLWVSPGTILEDVLEPTFWKHVAKRLVRADKIEVMPEDMAWRAVLIVRANSSLEAVVQPIAYDELGHAPDVSLTASPYRVEFVNSERKWAVKRRDSNETLKDGIQTREEAERYAANHTRLIAA